MPVRLAACEPCRIAKVSCDHALPICGRCRENNRRETCIYRERPFKRRRTCTSPLQNPDPAQTNGIVGTASTNHGELQHVTVAGQIPTPAPRAYPNPGYQGDLSHLAIFDKIKATSGPNTASIDSDAGSSGLSQHHVEDPQLVDQARFLGSVQELHLPLCRSLILRWLSKGVQLAMAGQFVLPCVETACTLLRVPSSTDLAACLFRGSRGPSGADDAMPVAAYCALFCKDHPGWATLGIFFVALSRAAEDIDDFPGLYSTRTAQHAFTRRVLRYADQCVELCLSLDCLNTLQVVLQYENFIAHSMIHGDQSYHSWRRLGDVVSSVFALGYHERIEVASGANTLGDLKCLLFWRAYSADKNVSIFLGRPYRVHRKQCSMPILRVAMGDIVQSPSNGPFDYGVETRWTLACALLKERVLDAARTEDNPKREQEMQSIRSDAIALEASLSDRFRLPEHLRDFDGSIVERDFVASAKLNLLHVHFLFHSMLVSRSAEPNAELINISLKMLTIAAEIFVLKDRLANSGTGLVWKIAFYGLPAAGIVCLAMLNQCLPASPTAHIISQAVQDLGVLVANVEAGVLVHREEPNYALLEAATATMKIVLNRFMTGALSGSQNSHSANPVSSSRAMDPWLPWQIESEPLDFEFDFWTNLTEHPAFFQEPV